MPYMPSSEGNVCSCHQEGANKELQANGDEMILFEREKDFGVVPRIYYRGVRLEAGRPDKHIFKIPGKGSWEQWYVCK